MAITAADVGTLPDRILLPFEFDPARLEADLAALGGEEWTLHFVPQNFDGEWSAMPLRAPADADHPIQMIYSRPDARDFVDTALLDRAPYLREVIGSFQCPVRCVRLMRLAPGSVIKEHRDADLSPEQGWARIHVPIVTNEDVTFFLNRVPLWMGPGEVWYLRLSDPHRVENRGATTRVHLVLDVEVNGWLVDELEAGLD
ncbi:aspartyl/asparaginyl beta-hydroxylase domain-containing protein [Sphingomonas canadensis]|uniref:Aspartyl/asparaginyl beta-hydroxylase domain-containing protein n=1 Tax=Sphingomonas canadensis TaxID=1219257 RepID=A0ABW3H3B1_9SPHN|nr:aspartyl/asparaginyl beta-hydroxylase domain-containing protein [Sphingomonas canadensis]MCW3835285.1 aspartyl/asparaginyl beta-hydroxylase domain-containing protein [Sphingomonas canadensis]